MARHDKKKNKNHHGDRKLFGIIDIGSNSVRLVVFEGLTRHPHVVFNEKVLCGLGRSVGKTGEMADTAMDRALQTLKRFATLAQHMKVRKLDAVATAAIRDARNGPDFVARVEAETGIRMRVIPGEEEARLSALGVLSGIPEAQGVVGDLGGGSLELVRVSGGGVQDRLTLPIGPVRLLGDLGDNQEAQMAEVRRAIAGVDWLAECSGQDFYIVGGAWRAVSRVHMAQERCPLPILQGYRISGSKASAYCDVIAHQHDQGLAGISQVPSRRLEVLPLAALILKECLDVMKPREVVTSSLGLREGVVFDALPEDERLRHPFIEACRDLADTHGRFPEHARRLMRWIDPLFDGTFKENDTDRLLRYGACLLSDISWRGHPDFRAERAVMEMLYGRFVGIDHRGRALIGMALNRNYGAGEDSSMERLCRRLLSEDDQRRAQLIGLALRLGHRLSGGTARVLKRSRLEVTDTMLTLVLRQDMADLAGETVQRRLSQLASGFNWESRIEIADRI